MALTEKAYVDLIEVPLNGAVQVRNLVVILRDGVEVSRSHIRTVLYPGQDLSNQEPRVVAIAKAVWTPEVVDAYQASLK